MTLAPVRKISHLKDINIILITVNDIDMGIGNLFFHSIVPTPNGFLHYTYLLYYFYYYLNIILLGTYLLRYLPIHIRQRRYLHTYYLLASDSDYLRKMH